MATGTLVDVVMPQMGVSVSEGTITRWAKSVGETDRGRRDDRRDLDRQGRHRGARPGDRRRPRAPGRRGRDRPGEHRASPSSTPAAAPASRRARRRAGGHDRAARCSRGAASRAEPARAAEAARRRRAAAAAPPAERRAGTDGEGRTFISPVVARMVAEHDLDINAIPGTGAGGRVTKKDVAGVHRLRRRGRGARRARTGAEVHDVPPLRAAAAEPDDPAPPRRASGRRARRSGRRRAGTRDRRGRARRRGEELYRFNTVRKVIARHMRQSLETAAQVTTVIEVDMTGVGRPAQEVEADLRRAPRRQPHLRPVHHPGDDGRDRPLAVGERRDPRRVGARSSATSTSAWPSRSTTPRASWCR